MFGSITKRQWTLIFLTIFLLLVFFFVLPISIPLVIALVTALVLNPLVRFTQKRMKINRKASVIVVFLLFMIFLGISGTFVVTKAVTQVVNFVEDIPAYVTELNNIYETWESNLDQYTENIPDEFYNQVTNTIESQLTSISETLTETITIERIAQFVAGIPQYLISFIVYLIALFLFMLELPLLRSKLYNFMTEKTAEKVSFMNKRLADVILGFFKAQFLVSIIIFVVSLIGLLLFTPDVAIIMSIIIWLIDFIPIIGSIAVLGPWAVFAFIAGDILLGIQLAVLAIILLAIRRTVEPKVMGQHIGLSPLATLIAMFLGIKLLGLLGFILGPLVLIAFNSAREAGIIKLNIKI
ncbi:sporulation integral membrane protein YtvI [Lentibacillus sp. CBA3610]|uniref:sporulation integral membrane protein YtvI n=1 Tax=Lentibacillus sp. CBA3610 TaxID=2518176 RepID=UPI0015953DE4|nr:sporulation integral membrane protein YtvI [Lentibacillus sp. CBA3610]QKY71588.1 sporulation integral membrane protein YtvI [Lentibacillus sp. CBA3610]